MNKVIEEFISLIKKNGKIVSTRLNRKYFENIHKETIFDEFVSLTNHMDDDSLTHRIQFCEAGYESELPKCYCGNKIKILSRVVSRYCSNYCAKHDPLHAEKISKTKKSQDSTNSNIKRKKTMLEKYGVEYNSQRKDIHDIWKRPKLNKYALKCLSDKDWLFENYVVQKKTGVEIAKEINCYYGTVLSFCNDYGFQIRQGINNSMQENYPELTKELINNHEKIKYYFYSVDSLDSFEKFISNDSSLKLDNNILQNYCLKHSIPFRRFCRFSKDVYKKIICEFLDKNNLKYSSPNNEIDILVEGKIALFINLINDFENSKNYFSRTKKFEKEGYRCIQLFEDHLLNPNKFKILQNIILHSTGKTKNKIYARKTHVKIFENPSDLKEFFNSNNIQGYRNSSIAFALLDESNQVVMSYCVGKSYFGKGKYDCEIIRGACLLGYSVIGGASKLWNAIIEYFKTHKFKGKEIKNIVYYVDANYYDGSSLSFLKNSKLIKEQAGFWNYFCLDDVMKNRDALHNSEIKNFYEKTKSALLKETDIDILRCNNYVFKIDNVGTKTFVIDL